MKKLLLTLFILSIAFTVSAGGWLASGGWDISRFAFITSGSIDNTVIGGTTPAVGTFTNLTSSISVITPQALTVTTEANITLTSSILLITGDNDSDNDAIDLQNGTTAGQLLRIAAVALVDGNDTITINMGDTTCTNCGAIVFDDIGENASLWWTGTTWIIESLMDAL